MNWVELLAVGPMCDDGHKSLNFITIPCQGRLYCGPLSSSDIILYLFLSSVNVRMSDVSNVMVNSAFQSRLC
jgi:hypothetical protein